MNGLSIIPKSVFRLYSDTQPAFPFSILHAFIMMKSFAVMSVLVAAVTARKFTVKNNCAFTVWPGLYTDLNAGSAVPDHATG